MATVTRLASSGLLFALVLFDEALAAAKAGKVHVLKACA